MENNACQRLKDIWNEWSKNLIEFVPLEENNYQVKTKFFDKNQELICFNLQFNEQGFYTLKYQSDKKTMRVSNIKEENLPAEILRFALMINAN